MRRYPIQSEVARRLISAVAMIVRPESSNADRAAAQQFLDKTRESAGSLMVFYGIVLAVPAASGSSGTDASSDPMLRHIGIGMIEAAVVAHWYAMEPSTREHVRAVALELLADCGAAIAPPSLNVPAAPAPPSAACPYFLREKVAKLLVTIAKREWPHQWGSLLDRLREIAANGPGHVEMVAIALRELAEGIKIFSSDVEDKRLAALNSALAVASRDIVLFLRVALEDAVTDAAAGRDAAAEQRARTLLSAMAAYLQWADLRVLQEIEVPRVLCSLLAMPPFRLAAVEAMLLLADRRPDGDVEVQFLLFPFQYLSTIARALSETDATGGDGYVFHKRMAQELALIGALHLRTLEDVVPPAYGDFLDLMTSFAEHPSIMISSFVLPFWQHFTRKTSWLSDAIFADRFSRLLPVFHKRLLRLPFVECEEDVLSSPDARTLYAQLGDVYMVTLRLLVQEVDDADDFDKLQDRNSSVVLQCIQNSLPVFFPHVMQDLLVRFNALFLTARTVPSPRPASTALCVQADALCRIVAIVAGHPSFASWLGTDERLRVAAEQLLTQLLSVDVSEEAVKSDHFIGHIAECIGELHPMLRVDANSAMRYLEAMFGFLIQFVGNRAAAREARTCACVAISRLCGGEAERAVQVLPQLASAIVPHLVDGSLQEHQVGILVNALVLASNLLPSYSEQKAFLDTLCRPFLDALMTPTLQTCLATPAAFAEFHCLADDSLLRIGPNSERLARLDPLRTLLAVISAAWFNVRLPQTDEEIAARHFSGLFPERSIPLRVRHPLAQQLQQLLPFALSTIRTLHAFSLVQVQNRFVPVPMVRAVFEKPVRVSEEGDIVHHGDCFDLETESNSEDGNRLPTSVVVVRRHMQRLRTALYSILGAMTNASEFYMVDNIGEHITQCVLVNIDSIHNYDLLRLMQSTVLPLASNCPNTEVREAMLGRTLPPLLAFLQHRLNPLWAQLLAQSEELAQVTVAATRKQPGGGGGGGATGLSKSQKKRLKMKSKSAGSSPSTGVQLAATMASSAASMSEPTVSVEQELAMEELVRLLSRALSDWMRRAMVSTTQPELTELGAFVFTSSNRALVESAVGLVASMIWWPDSTASRKATSMLPAILPRLSGSVVVLGDYCRKLLSALLQKVTVDAVIQPSSLSETLHAILSVYASFAPRTPVARQVLQSVQGVKPDVVTELDDALRAGGTSAKRQYQLISRTLAPLTEAARAKKSVLNLPDLDFLKQARKGGSAPSVDWYDVNPGVDLSALFS